MNTLLATVQVPVTPAQPQPAAAAMAHPLSHSIAAVGVLTLTPL